MILKFRKFSSKPNGARYFIKFSLITVLNSQFFIKPICFSTYFQKQFIFLNFLMYTLVEQNLFLIILEEKLYQSFPLTYFLSDLKRRIKD